MRRLTTTFLIALLLLACMPAAAQDDGGGIFGRIAGAINSAVSSASDAASSFVSSAVDSAQDTYRSASSSANAAIDRASRSVGGAVDRAMDTARDTYRSASSSANVALDRTSGSFNNALRDASSMTRRFGQQASASANAALDRAGSSFNNAMNNAASMTRRFGQQASASANAALDRAGSSFNNAMNKTASMTRRFGQQASASASSALNRASNTFDNAMANAAGMTRQFGQQASNSANSMLQRAGYGSFDEIMEGAEGVAGKAAQTAGETIDAVTRRAARPVRTILQRVEEHIAQTSPGAAQAVRAAFKMAEIDSLGDLTSIHTAARLMQVMDAQTLLELTETYGADAVEEAREMIAEIPAEELMMTVGLLPRPLTDAVVRQAHEAARLEDVVCGERNTYFVVRIDGSRLPGKVEIFVDTVGDAVISQMLPLPVPKSLLNVMLWEIAPEVALGATHLALHFNPILSGGLTVVETAARSIHTYNEWHEEQTMLARGNYAPVSFTSWPRATPMLFLLQARHSAGGKVVYAVDFDLSDGFTGDSPDLDIAPRPVCM